MRTSVPDLESIFILATIALIWILPLLLLVFAVRWYVDKRIDEELTRRLGSAPSEQDSKTP